jgi:hypothetical protein
MWYNHPMTTLYALTRKHSGIVLHRACSPLICDWTGIQGIPRWFGGEHRGVGEDIPHTLGHWHDDLSEWVDGLDVGDRRPPQRGWVYDLGGVVIVCPDEWE